MNSSLHFENTSDILLSALEGFINTNTSDVQNSSRVTHMYAHYAGGPLNKSLVGVTSILSMLGSLLIIFSYIVWKDIRTTSRTILLFISISDFFTAIGDLFGTFRNDNPVDRQDPVCVAQSFFTNTTSIMSFCWTATLALYLYTALVKNKPFLGLNMLPWLHVLNWSLGPVINIIAWNENMLGSSSNELTGGWCWIYHSDTDKDWNKEILWILIDAKLIEFLVYGSILVLCILIKVKLQRELKIKSKQPLRTDVLRAAKSADRKLVFIPILLILGRIWGTLRFLMFWAGTLPPEASGTVLPVGHKILLTLQGIGDSCQGLVNCILFCFMNPKVSDHLKECLKYHLCCHDTSTTERSGRYSDEREASVVAYQTTKSENESSLFFSAADMSRSPLLDGTERKYGGIST